MDKNISCIVAAAFIGASIYTMIKCTSCGPFTDYQNSLDAEQNIEYGKIVKERRLLYIKGLIVGIILAAAYLYYVTGTVNPMEHSCVVAAIVMFTQYMVYTLTPKSKYMVTMLKNSDQQSKWLDVYKFMKNRYHIGMLLGIVGYFILSYIVLNRAKFQNIF